MHDSVYDLAGDDPEKLEFLRTALKQLAASDDPLTREMAAGALDGSIDLRQAATSDAYSAAFESPSRAFWTYYEKLDDSERQELRLAGERHVRESAAEGPR